MQNGPNRSYEMQFQLDSHTVGFRPTLTADELNSVMIRLPLIPGSTTTVVQGQVKLIINATIRKDFNFPPQTNSWPIATSFLTNGTFIPLTSEQLKGL